MYNLNSSEITDRSQFLSINQQSLASLLTFVDFAAGLTIGFIEIDREQERDWIVEWLINSPECQDVNFLVLNYDDPNLRFLLDEILKSLSQQELHTTENLVLIIKGLEYSIGHVKYPPILQNLNFVRDAFVDALPYPILFCLPTYQITSVANFAPDFWAWKSGNFKFESIEQESIFIDSSPVEYFQIKTVSELQNRIDLLEGLLTEYAAPSHNSDLSIVVSILKQLGTVYHSRQEWVKAETYLVEALNTIEENSLVSIDKTKIWIDLADVYREQRKYDRAQELCQRVLNVDRDILTPPEWAETNNILGLIYLEKLQGNITKNLENAITCFQSILTFYTYQDFPKEWAQTQNHLGKAYAYRIGGNKADNLELSIKFHQEALKVRTMRAYPREWAQTQNNLGSTYKRRIYGSRAENIELAIECYQSALKIVTETDFPQDWARTKRNLGFVYEWRIRADRAENLKIGIECYQAALRVFTETDFPQDWARTKINLGNAYLRIRSDQENNQKLAIECYQAALRIFTETDFSQDWAQTKVNLAIVYARKIQNDRLKNSDLVIELCKEALRVYSETDFPQQWAQNQSLMGIAYERKINGEKAENIKRAIECYQNALKIYTPDTFPREWKLTQNLLSAISINSIP
jgi:tetratricopeptide (TPR) repeat protein